MALKWIVSAAFAQVLGQTDNVSIQHSHVITCPSDQVHVQECLKSFEDTKEVANGVGVIRKEESTIGFQMPLHYPKYSKADYEKMEEWRLDMLLNEYGLGLKGTLEEKRAYAMGAFLWPDQL